MQAALVLAAGASTRFSGGNKLLAPFRGRPMVRSVFDLALAAPVGHRLVVTGARAGEISALAEEAGLRVLHNPDFGKGMSTSLRTGLAALPADCSGALILLGDMPLIRPETLAAILACAAENPEAGAIVPVHAGEWGHPVYLARALFPAIMALEGDRGGRAVLQARSDVVTLETDDPGILADFDTREALESAATQ